MNRIAQFEKVSFEEFYKSIEKIKVVLPVGETGTKKDLIKKIYDEIELPTRATNGSAGYDFHCPYSVILQKGFPTLIPTGIRCKIEDGWVLNLYPRSGLGFKYGLHLLNTVGIIDSDYYNSDNEGHIMAKVDHNEGEYYLTLKQGDKFTQGVFLPYGITYDDNTNGIRNGGFGSTDDKERISK